MICLSLLLSSALNLLGHSQMNSCSRYIKLNNSRWTVRNKFKQDSWLLCNLEAPCKTALVQRMSHPPALLAAFFFFSATLTHPPRRRVNPYKLWKPERGIRAQYCFLIRSFRVFSLHWVQSCMMGTMWDTTEHTRAIRHPPRSAHPASIHLSLFPRSWYDLLRDSLHSARPYSNANSSSVMPQQLRAQGWAFSSNKVWE